MLTSELLYKTLKLEQIDPIIGLDYASRKYIVTLLRENAPIGSRSLGAMINEQESTILGMIEPFLLSDIELEHKEQGNVVRKSGPFVRITKKGRVATDNAYSYIKLCHSLQKLGWFNNESLNVKSE
jgi:Holliday junction resolvasome RuvABC ATP-dependent DNA helicase subunit